MPTIQTTKAGADCNIALQLQGILTEGDLELFLTDGQIGTDADDPLSRNGQVQTLDGILILKIEVNEDMGILCIAVGVISASWPGRVISSPLPGRSPSTNI